jgi:hypothetical protein
LRPNSDNEIENGENAKQIKGKKSRNSEQRQVEQELRNCWGCGKKLQTEQQPCEWTKHVKRVTKQAIEEKEEENEQMEKEKTSDDGGSEDESKIAAAAVTAAAAYESQPMVEAGFKFTHAVSIFIVIGSIPNDMLPLLARLLCVWIANKE